MRDFFRSCLTFLSILTLFAGLAWLAGITPDGILYGHWPDTGDHPTNWYDTALHREAQ